MAISHTATRRSLSPLLLVILALLLAAGRPAGAQSLPAGVYRAGDDGVTFPRAVRQVAPVYPIEAMRAGVHGVVQLEAIVGADGSVQDVRVVHSLDRIHGLDAEAVKAAKAWRFEAGLKDGTPVPVALTIEMTFAMSNEVMSAKPSRLRLVLLPYSALRKAVNAVFRLERDR
jgi:bla regulator protein blaR1